MTILANVNLAGGLLTSFRTMVDQGGLFEFVRVPPGDYVVWASEENRGPERTFATRRITVPENGLNDLDLTFKAATMVSGRIRLEDGGTFPNPGTTPAVTANIAEGTFGTGTSALTLTVTQPFTPPRR
jgi:hypothetical protein